tara:strand:- start:808 stop:1305 length:498 start_codon:yes stop_codon:yes gene_type:complete
MNPAQPLRILLVGTIPGARPATCDPAIDLVATTPAALTRYERERSDEARAGLAMLPGATPVLFEVKPLTARAWAWVQSETGERRVQYTIAAACHRYTDADGHEHSAKTEAVGKINIAGDEWVDELFDTFGAAAMREVAKVAMDRAEAGPRALAPFVLPHGLMLPR